MNTVNVNLLGNWVYDKKLGYSVFHGVNKKEGVLKPVAKIVFSGCESSDQTVLCCIPPKEYWKQIHKTRKQVDDSYVPSIPYVGLFLPFMKDCGSDIKDFVKQVLEPTCDNISPFTIQLDQLASFYNEEEDEFELFVTPTNNTSKFERLWNKLREKMPNKVKDGNCSDFIPYISLGNLNKKDIDGEISKCQKNWTSMTWLVDRVLVMNKKGGSGFTIEEEIWLGSDQYCSGESASETSGEYTPKVGDKIRALEQFYADDEWETEIPKGTVMTVEVVDGEGDIKVSFPGCLSMPWIFDRNFHKIRKCEENSTEELKKVGKIVYEKPAAGDKIKATETFMSSNKNHKVWISPGILITVIKVDNDGDIFCKSDGWTHNQWIVQRNFDKLRKVQSGEPSDYSKTSAAVTTTVNTEVYFDDFFEN